VRPSPCQMVQEARPGGSAPLPSASPLIRACRGAAPTPARGQGSVEGYRFRRIMPVADCESFDSPETSNAQMVVSLPEGVDGSHSNSPETTTPHPTDGTCKVRRRSDSPTKLRTQPIHGRSVQES
jgi:hypothetical protein